MNRRTIAPVVLAGTLVVEILVLGGAPVEIRALPVFAYLLVVPGLAVLTPLRLAVGVPILLGMAVTASLAIEAIVATALLYAEVWSAELALTIVLVITAFVVVIDFGPLLGARSRMMASPMRPDDAES